jgi:hypothetical protein
MDSFDPPIVSKDPQSELAELLERSLQLQIQLVEMQKRMRELHQQLAQGKMEREQGSM